MESKVLNYVEALQVADICLTYMSPVDIGEMVPAEFVAKIIEMANEEEMTFLLSLSDAEDIATKMEDMSTRIVGSGILEILEFYRQLGGK